MNSLEVYLIRHGKTICNENRLYCGKSDVSLSENGINELRELKNQIKYPNTNWYFTSGAKRANETLKILYPDAKYTELIGFLEYDFGDFEMKSYEMLKEDKAYIDWITDEVGVISCPNGESKKEYTQRINNEFESFIKSCVEDSLESVFLVSHGGTIGTIMENFYDASKNFYNWQPKCGQGYKLTINYEDKPLVTNIEEIKY